MTNEELSSRLEKRLQNTYDLNLVNMGLKDSNISEAIKWLATHPEITRVNFTFNSLGWQGFMELLAAPILMELELSHNKISFLGVSEHDSNILQTTNLKWVNVAYNNINAEGKEVLKNSNIKTVYYDHQLYELFEPTQMEKKKC